MKKNLLKITALHIFIILFWSFLYNREWIIEDSTSLNISSITLLYTVYLLIYGEFSSRKNQKIRNLFIFLSLGLLTISNLKYLEYNFVFIIMSIILTLIYAKKFIDTRIMKEFNILPISKKMTGIFSMGLALFSFILIYLLDLNSFVLNTFYQIIFLVFELCFILFLIEKENNYEKNYKIYYLSDYMARERNEFARIIHDDIIQDMYAVKNYLSLKNPDTEYCKEILNNLEKKSRNIIKFYQNTLFENVSMEENILSIFENIKNLYPNKNLKIDKIISEDLQNTEDKSAKKIANIITKELINNIYKHSRGEYIIYKIYMEDDNIKIFIESNGNSENDFDRITKSKRGILLIKLILENKGYIKYKLDKDILITEVTIEVEDENNFIR